MFKHMIKESKKSGLLGRIQDSYKDAEGLGDIVADGIKAVTGIEPTEDCNCFKRKQRLNKWVPFHKRK